MLSGAGAAFSTTAIEARAWVSIGLPPLRRAATEPPPRRVFYQPWLDLALELDLDLVADLQRAHHRRELLDAEVLLAERDRAADLVPADRQRDADLAALARDAQIT